MHRHRHGVQQQDRPGAFDDPLGVQLAEQPFDYPVLDPTVETFVDYMPVAVFLRQPPPFAPVIAYVQQCVLFSTVTLPRWTGNMCLIFPYVLPFISMLQAWQLLSGFHSGNTP